MTVNSTLAHSAIKSLKHAQECMIAINAKDYLPVANAMQGYIVELEAFIIFEATHTTVNERTERGE